MVKFAFEDNAEYGYGMWLASQTRRQKLAAEVLEALPEMSDDLQNLAKDWVEHLEDSEGTRARAEKMKGMLASEHFNSPKLDAIYKQKTNSSNLLNGFLEEMVGPMILVLVD